MAAESYPECEKLRKVHDERMAINEFVEWAGDRIHHVGPDRTDELVMEFFGIDHDKIETERREMLADLQTDPEDSCTCGHVRGGHVSPRKVAAGPCLVMTTAEQGRRGITPDKGTPCPCEAFEESS